MKKRKIEVGNQVRFIFPNYFAAMKADYTQPYFWSKPSPGVNHTMIGGKYNVCDSKRDKFLWRVYKLEEIDYWIPSAFLYPVDEAGTCPYKVGDEVYFKPECSEKEVSLLQLNSDLVIGKKYRILKIINDYYVILEARIPDKSRESLKLQDCKDESLPLRWVDLSSG